MPEKVALGCSPQPELQPEGLTHPGVSAAALVTVQVEGKASAPSFVEVGSVTAMGVQLDASSATPVPP